MKDRTYRKQTASFRNIFKAGSIFAAALLLSGLIMNSCQKEFEIIVDEGTPIELSASQADLVLNQKQAASSALSLTWTRGSNQGSGSSISYTLEIDKAGNDFATALTYDMGQGVFEKSYTGEELNDLVMDTWSIAAGDTDSIEARVTAHITDESIEDDVSDVITVTISTYKPVSATLYLVGSASSNGDDIANALELTSTSSKPWEFVYQDRLSVGSFLLSESQDDCWCKGFYTVDSDDEEMMIYNEAGVGDDHQWLIDEDAKYKITADLVDLTIKIEKLTGPDYENLYIIGDASPSGWDIAAPEAFTPKSDDPYIFTYEATFVPGEFKISAFQGDWCGGDMIMPSMPDQDISATDFLIEADCGDTDNKWIITEENQGRYKITVNLSNFTITIARVKLYLIGDGGPAGWDIATPDSMTYADGVYTFTGELGAGNPSGEIKISKFKGNWCDGDWINAAVPDQSLSSTDFIYTLGCDGPDNKWRLVDGDAGNYVITVNLDTDVLTITKQ